MKLDLYWIYAFNIIVNSTLSFLTSAILVEVFIRIFRIKHPRVKAICKILPFFKICFDLCLYHFSNWALLQGVNPILADKGTRRLWLIVSPITEIQLSMEGGLTFTLADVIALSLNPIWIQGIVFVAGFGSLLAIIRYLISIILEKRRVSKIVKASYPTSLPELRPDLMVWLAKKQIKFSVSTAIPSPCITRRVILFPLSLLETLSQEEIEAVIAHEIAHHCWKDCSLRLICSFVTSIFWWVPSYGWQKRLEEMQEHASDAVIHKFGISPLALSGAILKTAHKAKDKPSMFTLPFVQHRTPLTTRIQNILEGRVKSAIGWQIFQYGMLICCLLSLLLGRLWIF